MAQARFPSKPKGPNLAGLQSLLRRGDYCNARKRGLRALKKQPRHVSLNRIVGASSAGLGDTEAAIEFYQRAIGFGAQDAETQFALGALLMERGRLQEALGALAEALAADPVNAKFAVTLGNAFEQAGMFPEAQGSFEVAQALAPSQLGPALGVARCLYKAGSAGQAIDVLNELAKAHGQEAKVHSLRAACLGALGKLDAAGQAHRETLSCSGASASHYYNFTLHHDMTTEPMVAAEITQRLQAATDVADKRALHFALAKTVEDCGDYHTAYQHLESGNGFQKQELNYDVMQELQLFDQLKESFSGQDFPLAEPSQPGPIFIVGMPRSGTTLVEAILSRHPNVQAFGESNALLQAVINSRCEADVPDSEQRQYIAHGYHKVVAPAHPTQMTTDKMPTNFRMIGHIRLAFPTAKILHVVRDARAVCWSNFRTAFTAPAMGYSCDPEDLVVYYQAYKQLMRFWHERYPGAIHDVSYDDLTADPDREIPKLLKVAGLSWHEDCRSPENANLSVSSASQSQVRRGIYQGSSQAWRRYAPFAGHWLSRVAE